MNNHEKLLKSARISSTISILGILILVVTFIFAAYNLRKKQAELKQVKIEYDSVKSQKDSLTFKVEDLKKSEESLLEFLGKSLSEQSINRIQEGIDWNAVKNEIINLPVGKRKQSVLNAILLSWKEIPFELGQNNLINGFDSPGYIEYVLNSVGINIEKQRNIYLSQNIMNAFQKTDSPAAGDLMFYKGQQGNFGLIYLSKGDAGSEGVGIGTLQQTSPIGIYKYINTTYFEFIGYFKVNYESYP